MNGQNDTTDDRLRKRLFATTVLAEAIIIPTCAWTAFKLAGGDLAIAAPLLAVSALEACRIPLSSYATRLKFSAKLAAILALAGIGVLTAEVMTVGFSTLIDARLASVTEAASARDAAREQLAAETAALDRLTASAAAARAALVDLSAHPPALSEVKSQTCPGRHGRSYDCTPAAALKANAAAQAAYDARLREAQSAATAAQGRVDAAARLNGSEEALRAAEGRLRAAMAGNPMARLASGLSDQALDRVKSVVAVSLGAAIAFATSLLAFLAHLEPRVPGRGSKLARAVRAMIAARRKTLRRLRETVRTEYRDRLVHIPVDPVSGRILDPDVTR